MTHFMAFAAVPIRMCANSPKDQEFRKHANNAAKVASSSELDQARMLVRAAACREPGQNRPSADVVALALRTLEKDKRSARRTLPVPQGAYRLVMVANEKKKRNGEKKLQGSYFPIFGGISFFSKSDDDYQGQAMNTARVPFLGGLQFQGWYRWDARVSKLQFNFYRAAVKLFGVLPLRFELTKKDVDDEQYFNEQEDAKKLPFFAFFLIEPEYIAARGRGGGLALWRLDSPTNSHSL